MDSPTRQHMPNPGLNLPATVTAALDEVEAELSPASPDPDRKRLGKEVARYLYRNVSDPILRVLLSRPRIFVWCLQNAIQPEAAESPWQSAPTFRKAEPLSDPDAPGATDQDTSLGSDEGTMS